MSYTGVAGNFLGSTMQAFAAEAERQAMFREYQKEMQRQGSYQIQAQQAFAPNMQASGSGQAQKDLAQGASQRMQGYGALQNVPLSVQPGPESGAYKALDAAAYQQGAQPRAALGAYGDWQHQVGLGNLDTQRKLNQISSFAGGQAQVFPYKMYQAQHSQDELAFWGQLISSMGGTMGNMAALSQTQQPPIQQRQVNMGNPGGPAMWSGYGSTPPLGTGYNPYTDQSTQFGSPWITG